MLGELPPGPESMPIEAAREAVELKLGQRRRASAARRALERERWQAAALWRGMALAPVRDCADLLETALAACPISVERQDLERGIAAARKALRECEQGIELATREVRKREGRDRGGVEGRRLEL